MNIKLYTMCLIKDNDKVLLLNRQHDSYKGYVAPGGHIDFPESPVEGAIREVKEETGLNVRNLKYKGLVEFVEETSKERYMVFHYVTEDFDGELIKESKEGNPCWVKIHELDNYPMPVSFKKRLPHLLDENPFELHWFWNREDKEKEDIKIYKL